MKSKKWTIVGVVTTYLVFVSVSFGCYTPPTADLYVVQEYAIDGRAVNFDATGSTSDGGIKKYEWDFDNDSTYDYYETSSHYPDGAFDGKTVYIVDDQDNTTVVLRITDSIDNTDEASCQIDFSANQDSDNLPDEWETDYFGSTSYGDSDDYDNDNYDNLCEYLHGTDPNDSGDTPYGLSLELTVPGHLDSNSISTLLDVAIPGDKITVSEGTYYETLELNTDDIILTGSDPNDWEVVANTVIDANGANDEVIYLTAGSAGSENIIRGLTLTGGNCGIHCNSSYDWHVSKCIIRGNDAGTEDGGGIYVALASTDSTINNCFIIDNEADYGGGLCSSAAGFEISNCVIVDNTADSNGGGLYIHGNTTLTNCTITQNSSSGDGGGLFVDVSGPSIVNSIVWGNTATGSGDNVKNAGDGDPNFSFCDIEGCLDGDQWVSSFGTNGGGNMDSDPNFNNANDPNGTDDILGTRDDGLNLEIYSPCVDAADGDSASSLDITGRGRTDSPYWSNIGIGDPNYVDMGAYECSLLWCVYDEAGGNGDGGSWQNAFTDLQSALEVAEDGDVILVAGGPYKPTETADSNIPFELPENVALYGGFSGDELSFADRDLTQNPTILSGDIGITGDASDNSFHVLVGGEGAILDGFTISGGNADGTDANSCGGGLYSKNISMTVSNCVFTDNYGVDGGAVGNVSSPLEIWNCIFVDNDASDQSGKGGAVYNKDSAANLINCTFTLNDADSGAAIYNESSDPNLSSCILWGNETSNEIYNDQSSDCDIDHSCIENCFNGGEDWDEDLGDNLGNNTEDDPKFVKSDDIDALKGTDGYLGTLDDGLRIMSAGSCKDAGNAGVAPSTDILGLSRISTADIGAFESGHDFDGDGVPDEWEIKYGFGLRDGLDDTLDTDSDGLTNLEEYQIGTNPKSTDTDDDLLPDLWEHENWLNPLDANDANGTTGDFDSDGVNNLVEYQYDLDPNADSNGEYCTLYEYDNAGQVTIQQNVEVVGGEIHVSETHNEYNISGARMLQRRVLNPLIGFDGGASDANDLITLYSYNTRGTVGKTVRKGIGNTDTGQIQGGDLVTDSLYDALSRLTDVNDAEGGNTHYTYYTGGMLKDVNDPNGNSTTSYYDPNTGRLVKTVDAEGHYRMTEYDALGRTIKQFVCDSGSNALMQTRLEYNGSEQVTRRAVMADAGSSSAISTSVDMVVDYNYADSNGLLVSQTKYYAAGTEAVTSYGYDALGRRDSITDLCNNQTSITYDNMGRVTRRQQIEDDPLGSNDLTITTDYEYDDIGRIVKQIAKPQNPDANSDSSWQTTEYVYAFGNRIKETGSNGIVVTYEYSGFGRLEKKTADAVGAGKIEQITEYGYDRLGRQTSISGYANGSTEQKTEYTYDGIDRVTNVEYPDGNDIDFVYNAAGKVTRRIDQRGIVTDYAYDGVYNMLTKVVDGNGVASDANETFTYDGLGRMLAAEKMVGSGTVSQSELAYNDIGKITDSNEKLFGGTKRETGYSYDQAGFLTMMDYPSDSSIQFTITPDYRGRIASISWGMTLVTYDYIGSRVAKRRYPFAGGGYADYKPTYDNLGRITSARTHDNLNNDMVKFDYEYDPNTNNISKQTYDHRSGDPNTAFSYDNLDRLTQADYGIDDSNEIFTIDDLGNRDNVNLRTGSDEDYVIDANTNRYESIDSSGLEYDAAGNLTEDKDGCQYEYDYENRLVRVRDANDVNVAEFAYDALSRRIEKKDLVDANNTRRYYYNYKWQVLCEYDDANDLRNYYIYGNYIDEALIVQDAEVSNWNYYVHDHLYSTAALLEWNGTVVERYEYDAYGKCTVLDPNYAIDADQKSDYSNPYLFTGRRMDILDDGDLEIMYYRNRYYDAATGRFLTHDPTGYGDSLNLYEYVRSNPGGYVDSEGLSSSLAMLPLPFPIGDILDGAQSIIEDVIETALKNTDTLCPLLEGILLEKTDGPLAESLEYYFGRQPTNNGEVGLSDNDMKDIVGAFNLESRVASLREKCFDTDDVWSSQTTDFETGGNFWLNPSGSDGTGWGGTMNNLHGAITTSCESTGPGKACKRFSWTISIDESWDFDNIKGDWQNIFRDTLVVAMQTGEALCGWKPFKYTGQLSGTELPCNNN